MQKQFRLSVLFSSLLLLVFAFTGHTQTQKADSFYVGSWKISVKDAPISNGEGTLKIDLQNGKLKGTLLMNDSDSLPIDQMENNANGLTLHFGIYGQDIELILKTVDDNHLSGLANDQYSVLAERKI